MHINPNIAYFFHENELIAWDTKNQQQYAISPEYFERICMHLTNGNAPTDTPIDGELLEGKLLQKEPETPTNWTGSLMARLYHNTARNTFDLSKVPSEPAQFDVEYIETCSKLNKVQPPFSRTVEGEQIALPAPREDFFKDVPFSEVLKKRYTCRNFFDKSITLEQLSTLLFYGAGPIHGEWKEMKDLGLKAVGVRKAFPSAGGVHPEEVYAVVFNVENLANGIYHYNFQSHTLTLMEKGDFVDHLVHLTGGQRFFKGTAVGLFITAQLSRTIWKYAHSRSYRASLLDVGHCSQNLLLTSTALGLQTYITGVFHDSSVDKFLKIDDDNEAPYIFIGVGYGEGSFAKSMIDTALKG